MENELLESYKVICEKFQNILDVNTYIYGPDGSLYYECLNNSSILPIQLLLDDMKNKIISKLSIFEDFPILLEGNLSESYLIFYVSIKKNSSILIVIGPILQKNRSFEELNNILDDNTTHFNRELSLRYLKNLKIISIDNLALIASFFFYTIHNRSISVDNVKQNFTTLKDNVQKRTYEEERIQVKLTDQFQYDMQFENRLLSAISKGNPDGVESELESLSFIDHSILSKKSFLRSVKNKAIASVTLASRTAISSGVEMETAFTLSNHYIRLIEDLDNVVSIRHMIISVFINYSELVKKVNLTNLSSPTLKAQQYIASNIFVKIMPSDVASHVNLSLRHLSRTFKKEIGVTVGEYILSIKILEAKNMLEYTNYSISDISSTLGFLDQSHFTKNFKKISNMTPLQYRKKLIK